MYTPTKKELEELGFKFAWNIRKPYEWFIVNDSFRVLYFIDKWKIQITWMSIIPHKETHTIKSIDDLKNLICILTPHD